MVKKMDFFLSETLKYMFNKTIKEIKKSFSFFDVAIVFQEKKCFFFSHYFFHYCKKKELF